MPIKKTIAMLTLLMVLIVGTIAPGLADGTVKDTLLTQITDSARHIVSEMDDQVIIYANIDQASESYLLPARFDLREQGVVPAIRNQGSFGTCWSFAVIGASEISILSDLGMTTQEYLAHEGMDMDLSEKHLAWFASVPLPAAEGMSVHDMNQVGEGRQVLDDDGSARAHFNLGGFTSYASSMFASGMGPVPELLVPYTANDGTDSIVKDWSVDEDLRFAAGWEMKNPFLLPSPAGRDADGNYVYNPIATEMIKRELLRGRGVSICYYADQAMDPDAAYVLMRDQLVAIGIPEEYANLYIAVQKGELGEEELSETERKEVRRIKAYTGSGEPYETLTDERVDELLAEEEEFYALLSAMNVQEEPADDDEAVEEAETEADEEYELDEETLRFLAEFEASQRAAAEQLGLDFDAAMAKLNKQTEGTDLTYMNLETNAQYVWAANIAFNHGVVIVGYDDEYPALNFLPEHQPPADGAWIVRNSWGPGYGDDGYFYLSYYDQSIAVPETYEYMTDRDSQSIFGVYISEYDLMPAPSVTAGTATTPIYLANEFTIEADSVLSYVSAMTVNMDTNVTTAVYLLNEDAGSPTDGELLDVCTTNYEYAGYHRIPLSQHYLLPAGAKISVVQTQRYNDANGLNYALPYTMGLNSSYAEVYNTMVLRDDLLRHFGTEGKVGHGESFVCADGIWYDWADLLDEVKNDDQRVKDFVSFDNLSLKAYLYLLEDINEEHAFGEAVPYAGGNVRLCTKCGYTLVEK